MCQAGRSRWLAAGAVLEKAKAVDEVKFGRPWIGGLFEADRRSIWTVARDRTDLKSEERAGLAHDVPTLLFTVFRELTAIHSARGHILRGKGFGWRGPASRLSPQSARLSLDVRTPITTELASNASLQCSSTV